MRKASSGKAIFSIEKIAKAMETSPDVEERMKEVLAARLDHEIKVILDGTVK